MKRPPRFLLPLAALTALLGAPLLGQSTALRIEAAHVMRRLAFGPKTSELLGITTPAELDVWIQQQLDGAQPLPHALDELVEDFAKSVPSASMVHGHGWTNETLRMRSVAYATFSPNQLREKLTTFWHQHFNTASPRVEAFYIHRYSHLTNVLTEEAAREVGVYAEWKQNNDFRANAIGTFRNLLDVSMNSAPMRIYLHAFANAFAPGVEPNEDLARELLELHCFGPEDQAGVRNYSEDDVQELASFITGWSVLKLDSVTSNAPVAEIENNGSDHNPSGFSLGEASAHMQPPISIPLAPSPVTNAQLTARIGSLLDQLAGHRQTADFVCRKLAIYFVRNWKHFDVPDSLVGAMKAQWGAQGNIRNVMEAMIQHPTFAAPASRWALVKTPLESEASAQRLFDNPVFAPTPNNTNRHVSAIKNMANRINIGMGQRMFVFPSPDGYAIESEEQAGIDRAVLRFASSWRRNSHQTAWPAETSVRSLLLPLGLSLSSAEVKITNAALDLAFQNKWTNQDRNMLRQLLDLNPADPANPNTRPWTGASSAEKVERLRLMGAMLTGMAQMHVK